MSLEVMVIGDLHSKRSNQDELIVCAERISGHVLVNKPKAVVILGDLANDHEKVYLPALNGMSAALAVINQSAVQIGAKVYYVLGNHDAETNQIFLSDSHVMNVFKHWPNIVIVDRVLRVKSAEGYITFCPYVPAGRFVEALDTIGRDNWLESKIIFCHQEFMGATIGGWTTKHGDEWPPEWPQVVSGHIHAYSRISDNLLYIGAPMYHTFADDGEKTISLLNLSEGSVTETRIDLGMTKKITKHLTIAEAKTFVVPENANVRLYISGTTQEFAKFKKTDVYSVLCKSTKVIPQITDPVKLSKNESRRGYLDLLTDSCNKENEHVKDALVVVCQKSEEQ